MTTAERARVYRERKRARGECARCSNTVLDGQTEGPTCRIRASVTHELQRIMDLLAENRCIICRRPKNRFHPIAHRHCKSHFSERLPKSA
jgi:hypothetical protein